MTKDFREALLKLPQEKKDELQKELMKCIDEESVEKTAKKFGIKLTADDIAEIAVRLFGEVDVDNLVEAGGTGGFPSNMDGVSGTDGTVGYDNPGIKF